MKKWNLILCLFVSMSLTACDDNKKDGDSQQSISSENLPNIIPPAPGEEGGLEDDRTLLNEGIVDPQTIQGAGLIIEEYAIALEEGNYSRAYTYWLNNGQPSNMSKNEFIESFSKYQTMKTMIGRPIKGETENSAIVPLQIYGRLENTKEPFNLIGNMFLVRENDKWMITKSALNPKGKVREMENNASSINEIDVIPEAYRGHWAQTIEACNTPIKTNIIVYPLIINYWEAEAAISNLTMDNGKLYFKADLHDADKEWKDEQSLTLSNDNKILIDDNGLEYIKCPDTL